MYEKNEYLTSGTETPLRVRTSSYDVNLTLKGQKKKVIYSSMLLTFRKSTVIVEASQDFPFVRQSKVDAKTNIGGRIHTKNRSSRTKACYNASHFVHHKSNMDWPKPEHEPTSYEPYALARLLQVWIRIQNSLRSNLAVNGWRPQG